MRAATPVSMMPFLYDTAVYTLPLYGSVKVTVGSAGTIAAPLPATHSRDESAYELSNVAGNRALASDAIHSCTVNPTAGSTTVVPAGGMVIGLLMGRFTYFVPSNTGPYRS